MGKEARPLTAVTYGNYAAIYGGFSRSSLDDGAAFEAALDAPIIRTTRYGNIYVSTTVPVTHPSSHPDEKVTRAPTSSPEPPAATRPVLDRSGPTFTRTTRYGKVHLSTTTSAENPPSHAPDADEPLSYSFSTFLSNLSRFFACFSVSSSSSRTPATAPLISPGVAVVTYDPPTPVRVSSAAPAATPVVNPQNSTTWFQNICNLFTRSSTPSSAPRDR